MPGPTLLVQGGAGDTVKSVKRFGVVCDATTVPSRQTCEPIVARGSITWRKGDGLPEDVA